MLAFKFLPLGAKTSQFYWLKPCFLVLLNWIPAACLPVLPSPWASTRRMRCGKFVIYVAFVKSTPSSKCIPTLVTLAQSHMHSYTGYRGHVRLHLLIRRSFTHIHKHPCHWARGQSGVEHLTQGRCDTLTAGAWDWTSSSSHQWLTTLWHTGRAHHTDGLVVNITQLSLSL